jgi:hypothetical protein
MEKSLNAALADWSPNTDSKSGSSIDSVSCKPNGVKKLVEILFTEALP